MRSLKFGYSLLMLGVISISIAVTAWVSFHEASPPAVVQQKKITSFTQTPPPVEDIYLTYAREFIETTFTFPKELKVTCHSFSDYARCYVLGPGRERQLLRRIVICKGEFECISTNSEP